MVALQPRCIKQADKATQELTLRMLQVCCRPHSMQPENTFSTLQPLAFGRAASGAEHCQSSTRRCAQTGAPSAGMGQAALAVCRDNADSAKPPTRAAASRVHVPRSPMARKDGGALQSASHTHSASHTTLSLTHPNCKAVSDVAAAMLVGASSCRTPRCRVQRAGMCAKSTTARAMINERVTNSAAGTWLSAPMEMAPGPAATTAYSFGRDDVCSCTDSPAGTPSSMILRLGMCGKRRTCPSSNPCGAAMWSCRKMSFCSLLSCCNHSGT